MYKKMDKASQLLSEIVAFRTYAKYIPHLNRRETLEETINRDMIMHLEKFPKLSADIMKAFKQVHELKVMPSMRSLQFGGQAITTNHLRMFNCSAIIPDYPRVFAEIAYILLSGTGVGSSVCNKHIKILPALRKPKEENEFIVHDSIEGWAESFEKLTNAYFYGAIRPIFDYSKIREKNAVLHTTGAKAPGPEPLKHALELLELKLKLAIGRQLTSIEVFDIICIISDCVVAGGVRRAALIILFDHDDETMLKSKSGDWWTKNPHRARANISAVLKRGEVTQTDFNRVFDACISSGAGEPGFFFTNNTNYLTNPCCFSGDTLLLTENGYQPLQNLNNLNFKAININNMAVNATVTSTGVKKVVELVFSDKTHIRCTPDHRFMDVSQNTVEAKDLLKKRVMPHFTLNRDSNDFTNEQLAELGFSSEQLPSGVLPLTYHDWNDSQKIRFLRGIYTANGYVVSKTRVAFKTTHRMLADQIKTELQYFNIESYITINKSKKESYDINIGQFVAVKKFAELIGFVQEYKQANLIQLILDKAPMVKKIISMKKEIEVFDFTLDDETHWGVVSTGLIAHNCEIALRCAVDPNSDMKELIGSGMGGLCNLTTVNVTGVKDKRDLHNRFYAAALIGTLQASYTDFPFLNNKWKLNAEDEALLGVSMTGICDNTLLDADTLQEMAELVKEVNIKYAKKIGIKPAKRLTCLKPDGTSSIVLGSASGVHARHSEYYLRRIRMGDNDSLAHYLKGVVPDLLEVDTYSKNSLVLTIPQKSPENSITREQETAEKMFDRVMHFNKNWVKAGHIEGSNRHNVSCTINFKPEDVEFLKKNIWKNREDFSGMSLLPYDGGTYVQAPFEECTKEVYEALMEKVKDIDLIKVIEFEDNTTRQEQLACSGGACEVDFPVKKAA